MSDSVLIVIDAQESFRDRPYWSDVGYADYVAKQQALIDGCVTRGIPVIQVFHVEDEGAFSLASGKVRALKELSLEPTFVVHKHMHSALAGSPLVAWLTARGVRRLIISGIRSEQCCETTTRHAFDSGYVVDYVTEATMTFAMTHAGTGHVYSAADIKERCELVLDGRFATVRTVAGLFAALDSSSAKAAA